MRQFIKDDSGAMSVGFGAGIFTLLLISGMAIDAGRAYSYRTTMQDAIDASTIHAAQNARQANYQTKAQDLFNENFDNPKITNVESQYSQSTEFVHGQAWCQCNLA